MATLMKECNKAGLITSLYRIISTRSITSRGMWKSKRPDRGAGENVLFSSVCFHPICYELLSNSKSCIWYNASFKTNELQICSYLLVVSICCLVPICFATQPPRLLLMNSLKKENATIIYSLLAFFLLLVIRNAWVSDDAIITFRVVENFLAGYGLGYNPYIRVQAFTHPLWMLLISLVYWIERLF